MGPNPCRGHQRLGLAQHTSAAPIADRDVTRPPQAAAALAARAQANAVPVDALRQAVDQRPRDPLRRFCLGIFLDLGPKILGLALARQGIGAQPGLAFEQQRGLRVVEPFAISLEHGIGRRPIVDVLMASWRKLDAGDETDQIERVGHPGCFIEIIDAPDQAAVGVAPGSEIFQMQVADREHLWRVHHFRTP